ncbi:MAG: twin-arginine translocase subunit TatC [Saprospiraceae bacterium]
MEFITNKKIPKIKKNENPTKEMSFFEHIEELRWTILRALLYIIVLAVVIFTFKDFVFSKIIFGFLNDDFPTYKVFCALGDRFCIQAPHLSFITRQMGEQFFVHFKVSVSLALVIAFPLIIWEIWKFIAPGLNIKEQKITGRIIAVCSFLFYFGVSFGYFVIAPFAIIFFANYSVGTVAETMPTLDSYVGFLTMLTIPAGLVFELPVVIYFLAKAGIISSTFLKQYRKHAIIVIMILSAIITPPDAFTQILIGIPVLFIYEVGIIVAKNVEKKRKDD